MELHLDEPVTGQVVGDVVKVRGWAHAEGQAVARVIVSVGDHRVRALIGRERPDVAEALGDIRAALAGFEADIDLQDVGTTGTVAVVVEAVGMDQTTAASRDVLIESTPRPATVPAVAGRPLPSADHSRRRLRAPRRVRLLVAARSLDQGGSQLRMAELLEALADDSRFELSVLSPHDGPLRSRLEEVGVVVHVRPDVRYDDPVAYAEGVAELATWMGGRFDLVYGFTLTCFAALEAAALVQVPRALRVGENEPLAVVSRWVGMPLHPDVERSAVATIDRATLVVFNSRSGLEAHTGYGLQGQFRVLHSGIDTVGPARSSATVTRSQARRELGLPDEARIFLSPASLWPVKAQGTLVHAFAAVAGRHPRLHLVMIGLAAGSYPRAVQELVEVYDLADRVMLRPFGDDLSRWWRAADVLVCSSETEAAPAIVLEAGAWGLPVASTNVGNVAEVITRGESGWMCEPSDTADLARILEHAASTSDPRLALMGQNLRRRVLRDHDRDRTTAAVRKALLAAAAGRSSKQRG